MSIRKWLLLAVVAGSIAFAWFGGPLLQPEPLPDGFARSNGRIEAVEIDIATRTSGRLDEVLVNEGDFITAGQPLARMETDILQAQLREAEAELRRAKTAVDAAQSSVLQRESEKAASESVVAQRRAELDVARRTLTRVEQLREKNASTDQDLDEARATFFGAEAAQKAAEAHVSGTTAAIATARSNVIQAEASVDAAQAKIERLQVEINDSTLKSPREGRVQFRIAQPGEVLSAGAKVLSMVDLTDVSMTFFLPTAQAGRIRMGSEARLILDAAPQYVIPARVSFVADVAQFTPKTVETTEERQKLMFRIKARIDPELLRQHIRSVKTGLPGLAWVQLDEQTGWPADLEVRLPQ